MRPGIRNPIRRRSCLPNSSFLRNEKCKSDIFDLNRVIGEREGLSVEILLHIGAKERLTTAKTCDRLRA